MSNRYSSKGLQLQVSIASVFATVAAVKKLDLPDDETQFFDGTGFDDEDIQDGEPTGYGVPGTCSADLFLDPLDTNHKYLFASRAGKRKEAWQIVNPAIANWSCTFNGAIKKLKPTGSVGGALECSCEIKLSSIAVYAVDD
ncbi:MAG: hypothetical protein E6Q76_12795 [Rhizobium sp.]|nr:MAG: hypothetical protein E6Q76_12795 [Rhizobium sp.]